jgi:hypothetical protein
MLQFDIYRIIHLSYPCFLNHVCAHRTRLAVFKSVLCCGTNPNDEQRTTRVEQMFDFTDRSNFRVDALLVMIFTLVVERL